VAYFFGPPCRTVEITNDDDEDAVESHTRTVVRKCSKGDEASQWKRPKFDPPPHWNPLTDLHKNWHAWFRHGRNASCKILYRSVQGSLFPLCRAFGVTSFFFGGGFFNKATAYTPKRIVTQSTSEHVVPGKKVSFGGLDDYIWYLDP